MDTPGDVARSLQGYEIVETLGQGGFGVVYRARQVAVGRDVAIKIDNRVLVTDRDRRRFMREVTAAGRLSDHPHVVAVYDAGVLADGRPYMVLELCPQGSLADRLRSSGPFPASEVRDIGVRIAGALAVAHGTGVLHRDVKPANILVNRYGTVALADFGLAVLSTPGMESSATREALTPAYASPEAFDMVEPTPAGDVYALAATLYALLSGRPPYHPPGGPPNLVALMAARFGPVPDIPGAPPGLLAVLRHAMAYDPANRPGDAAAFRDDLAAADLAGSASGRSGPAVGGHGSPVGAVGGTEPEPRKARGSHRPEVAGMNEDPRYATTVSGEKGLRSPVLAAAVIAAAIIGAGVLVAHSIAGDPGAASKPSAGKRVRGVPAEDAYGGADTDTQRCPAAAVPDARARCTKTAECWGGIVAINGDVAINRSDCAVGHAYETFAVAPLPTDGQTWNKHTLEDHPTVKQVCSRTVMARSRFGEALRYAPGKWTIQVVPPSRSAFDQGMRAFRCVATITDKDSISGSLFRPRS